MALPCHSICAGNFNKCAVVDIKTYSEIDLNGSMLKNYSCRIIFNCIMVDKKFGKPNIVSFPDKLDSDSYSFIIVITMKLKS